MADRRLFFALWPSDRQREQLRNPIKAALADVEGRAVPRWNWHVTLVFIGAFPEQRIPELQAAVAAIEVEPFRLRFDRLEHWARPRIACLLAATVPPALSRLKSELEAAGAFFDLEPEAQAYRPHITIARAARPFAGSTLPQPVVTEWSSFELVESQSRPEGVLYQPLAPG